MTTFLVDGQEYQLSIVGKNGIDYSDDFIGNTAHGMAHDEDGRYIATQEDFEWWQKVMADHEDMNRLVEEYISKYGFEMVSDHLESHAVFDADIDMQPRLVREALAQLD